MFVLAYGVMVAHSLNNLINISRTPNLPVSLTDRSKVAFLLVVRKLCVLPLGHVQNHLFALE
jgi:hypothetical protein